MLPAARRNLLGHEFSCYHDDACTRMPVLCHAKPRHERIVGRLANGAPRARKPTTGRVPGRRRSRRWGRSLAPATESRWGRSPAPATGCRWRRGPAATRGRRHHPWRRPRSRSPTEPSGHSTEPSARPNRSRSPASEKSAPRTKSIISCSRATTSAAARGRSAAISSGIFTTPLASP